MILGRFYQWAIVIFQENEQLQVTLVKISTDKMWRSLLKNIDIAPSTGSMQCIRDLSQPPTSTLRTEMEDCDYGDGDLESEYFLGTF